MFRRFMSTFIGSSFTRSPEKRWSCVKTMVPIKSEYPHGGVSLWEQEAHAEARRFIRSIEHNPAFVKTEFKNSPEERTLRSAYQKEFQSRSGDRSGRSDHLRLGLTLIKINRTFLCFSRQGVVVMW